MTDKKITPSIIDVAAIMASHKLKGDSDQSFDDYYLAVMERRELVGRHGGAIVKSYVRKDSNGFEDIDAFFDSDTCSNSNDDEESERDLDDNQSSNELKVMDSLSSAPNTAHKGKLKEEINTLELKKKLSLVPENTVNNNQKEIVNLPRNYNDSNLSCAAIPSTSFNNLQSSKEDSILHQCLSSSQEPDLSIPVEVLQQPLSSICQNSEILEEKKAPELSENEQASVLVDDNHVPDLADDKQDPDVSDDNEAPELSDNEQVSVLSDDNQVPDLADDNQDPDVSDDNDAPDLTDEHQAPEHLEDNEALTSEDDSHPSPQEHDFSDGPSSPQDPYSTQANSTPSNHSSPQEAEILDTSPQSSPVKSMEQTPLKYDSPDTFDNQSPIANASIDGETIENNSEANISTNSPTKSTSSCNNDETTSYIMSPGHSSKRHRSKKRKASIDKLDITPQAPKQRVNKVEKELVTKRKPNYFTPTNRRTSMISNFSSFTPLTDASCNHTTDLDETFDINDASAEEISGSELENNETKSSSFCPRRSKRKRFKPLRWYKGEHLIYTCDVETIDGDSLASVAGVVREGVPTPAPKENVRKSRSKRNAVVNEEPIELPSKYIYEKEKQTAKVWSERQQTALDTDIICRKEKMEPRELPSVQGAPSPIAGQAFSARGYDKYPGWISGFLDIPPGGIKEPECVGDCTLIFCVLSGQPHSIQVSYALPDEDIYIEKTAQRFLLSPNDHFYIPPRNSYHMVNHSKSTACQLHFTILKPIKQHNDKRD